MTTIKTEKAVKRIINSVWTITFIRTSETEIEVLRYSREDRDGYEREHELPKGRLEEDNDRTVIGAFIDGQKFTVKNQRHIFSYEAAIAKATGVESR